MDSIVINTWIIFFSVAAAQGIFIALLLYAKDKQKLRFLAFSMLCYSLMMAYYVVFWSGLSAQLPRQFGLAMGFTFLIGPFLYFYLKHTNKGLKNHLIPFVAYGLIFIIAPYLPWHIAFTSNALAVFQCIHLVAYCIKLNQISNESGWAKQVYYSFLGYTITFLSYYLLVWTGSLKIEYDYYISLVSSIFIYYTAYRAFIYPNELSFIGTKKYQKSALSLTASRSILKTLRAHMEENKAYRDNELKLSTLSEQLGLSPNHISQVINELTKYNFSDFINHYRVEEAKALIESSDQKPVFIEIAFDVGFNNKASFNNAFKKFTQMSPSAYYNSLAQKMSA
ncbi:MAG: helix-turn-helix domain-containing protein [Fulvivirga sp.]|uniref:helix-turn-helix domain-containing protein n=1 Tax=Fulvivirga sp. TaxID=1931237 RepID=UPI0032ED7BEF